MKGDREQCLAAGMDGYIAKPIRPAELLAEIDRHTRLPAPNVKQPLSVPEDDCIDWQAAWANLEGDRSLLSELALLFLDDLPEQLGAIRHAADAKQARDLERLAHRLKGSVANFAAKPAFEAAFHVEKIAGLGDFEQLPQAVEALEREMLRLQSALEACARSPVDPDGVGLHLAPPPPPAASNSDLAAL